MFDDNNESKKSDKKKEEKKAAKGGGRHRQKCQSYLLAGKRERNKRRKLTKHLHTMKRCRQIHVNDTVAVAALKKC
ncbi:MAG: hypothetical protein Q8L47_01410 [bacterium]|nr:hypothetical protein [bacterium]